MHLAACLLCLCSAVLDAADERIVDLPTAWRFRTDPQEIGVAERWQEADPSGPGWTDIVVPASWESQGRAYNGIAWYSVTVMLPEELPEAVWFALPAADETDVTYLNGRRIGGTKGDHLAPRLYRADRALLQPGANRLVVQVEDRFGDGGLIRGRARMILPGDGRPEAVAAPGDELSLPLVTGTDPVALMAEWPSGWRDEGTTDTRMRLYAVSDGPGGTPALGLDVWFPTSSGEFVQRRLPAGVDGTAWAAAGVGYLAFSYRATTAGDLRVHLSRNGFTWGKGDEGHGATVQLSTVGTWTRVVVPFAAFVRSRKDQPDLPLGSPQGCGMLSIGYRNNELQSAGHIELGGFAVGHLAANEAIPLDTAWRMRTDPDDIGLAQGWAAAGHDDADWEWWLAGSRVAKSEQVLWFRRAIHVPETWAGRPLNICAGSLNDGHDTAMVLVDGVEAGRTVEGDRRILASLPAGLVPGRHVIAVHMRNPKGGAGLMGDPGSVAPDAVSLALLDADGQAIVRLPEQVGAAIAVGIGIPSGSQAASAIYEVRDVFHHVLAKGTAPCSSGSMLRIELGPEGSRRAYYSEALRIAVLLQDAAGRPLAARIEQELPLLMQARDTLALPALAEAWEDTPYGRLRLVDRIDAAADPATIEQPYKEGGIRKSWVGRRAYSTWEDGVRVAEWNGRRFREAGNNAWFGWRIGRALTPHRAYLLRLVVPDDRPRYVAMNIQAGRNYQGTGYAGGIAPDDPSAPYPQTGTWQTYDHVVIADERTYGADGARSADGRLGFWVFLFDIGRCYAAGYQGGGPAVSELRLYELPADAAPRIAYPAGQPHRTLMADWEREPEMPAADAVLYARLIGLSALAPSMLKWGRLCYWGTGIDYEQKTTTWDNPRAERPAGEVPAYDRWLDATRGSGLVLVPRVEVGGSSSIPVEQRAIAANGRPAAPNRFHKWCSDLTQPAIRNEFERVIDEVVSTRLEANPQLGGLLWRIRSDRLPISYGLPAVQRFAAETGVVLPELADDAAAAAWARAPERRAAYETWWHGVRRDLHRDLAARLQRLRPDLRLWYYNWDPDGWHLGRMENGPQDYTDWRSRLHAADWYARGAAFLRGRSSDDLLALLRSGDISDRYGGRPHHSLRMDLYRDERGLGIFGPLWYWYLADAGSYLREFDAAAGGCISVQAHYEEKGRWNVQADNYESSEMTPGGADFAMTYEVMACWHLDPTTLSFTSYTLGRGHVDRHRVFAMHYLALPAVRADGGADLDPELRLRLYPGVGGTRYAALVHRGTVARRAAEVRIPGTWSDSARIIAADGSVVPARIEDGVLVATVGLPPMSLYTVRIEP